MPTYEYKCKECEHSFEAVQSMKDEPLSICPECGGAVRRVLSGGAGVIFKGQGFYVTDKVKSAAGGAAKKNATSTANSNTDAGSPCSACPAAAAGAPCAARADNAT
ncbi:MAG: zinc ribbon domain-containing protein [Spirochaetaceae bacterium]|jgi:putative FmdB family regulatory protein|nr:zinc ribbon domain-containing protein [Spirochaetaceae bacterium]